MTSIRDAVRNDLADAPRPTPIAVLRHRNARRRASRAAARLGSLVILVGGVIAVVVMMRPASGPSRVITIPPPQSTAPPISAGSAAALAHEHMDATLLFRDIGSTGLLLGDPKTGALHHMAWNTTGGCAECLFGFRLGDAMVLDDGHTISVLRGTVTHNIGRGAYAFPAPDDHSIFVISDSGPDSVSQWDLNGSQIGGPWTPPTGYGYTGGARGFDAHAVVGGILVETQENATDHTLALWNPRTNALRRIGNARWDVIDTYTAPGATSSTIAWIHGGCATVGCDLALTDTATWRTRTIAAPTGHYGYWLGGAFSPDGRQLATFAGTVPTPNNPAVDLTIIDVATSRATPIRHAHLAVGEPSALAGWSPSGAWLFFSSYGPPLAHRQGTNDATTLPFNFGGLARIFLVAPTTP